MSKKKKRHEFRRSTGERRTILIDGVRYYADKPVSCRHCWYWKNRRTGCILGKENCYYLAEKIKTAREKKCDGCCYSVGRQCLGNVCFREMNNWLMEIRKGNALRQAGCCQDRDPAAYEGGI